MMDQLLIRDAVEGDLAFIVSLIDGDTIAARRDQASPADAERQLAGFRAISADPNNRLLVAELAGQRVGTFQLSFIPGVSRRGAWRGQIEAVRVAPHTRRNGIGRSMMVWAIDTCRKRGCGLVQLTSDRQRIEAHRFYEDLGFAPSHTGFKLSLR